MPNILGFTLLEMIAREASSGYELAHQLKIMQNTHHSQIYPSLSDLEEKGFLIVHVQKQEGKPNKKVYSITELGLNALKEWANSTLKPPVIRDEFIIKLQLDWLEPEQTNELLHERKKYLENQKSLITETLFKFKKTLGLTTEAECNQNMPYQIYARRLDLVTAEIEWCDRLLQRK
ncbi:PadR family transcriptional regulator [Listeria sp. PSOL-1]|uniref:PadR family transcriptional regulator n=1 Tax=Listeria sp. PSOL-1 TaxID=1844999 RepID=UPI0013CF8A78|nr:helix-turn-helix transcriptional regulator [Listeria sp. PSOL-1]